MYNSNVDSECEVEIEDGRKFRVHQTGYIEGDTGGFVEGDYEIFELDEDGEYGDELSNAEGMKFIDLGFQIERQLVFLDGKLGEEAIRASCFFERKTPIEFDGKLWRVFKLRHPNPVYGGDNRVGTHINNAECLVTLVTFGATTLFEAINDQTELVNWEQCDCVSYRYEDY